MIWHEIHSLSRHHTRSPKMIRCPRRDNLHATAHAIGMTIKPRRFGDREHFSHG
jgi:hypothetical protein